MRKFVSLVKKEVRELLTPLMILPLVISVGIFMGIGKIADSEMQKSKQAQPIAVVDQDKSTTSGLVISALEKSNFKVRVIDQSVDEALADIKKSNESALIVIPDGMEVGLQSLKQQKVELIAVLRSFSTATARNEIYLKTALESINQALSTQMIQSATAVDSTFLKQPIIAADRVVVEDRQANASFTQIMGFITNQIYFIPIILFIVILFASQMIATSIASEKENKTLETLLSLPVSRQSIVMAKLVAAGIVAAISALVYMFGFRSYMTDTMSSIGSSVQPGTQEAIRALDLTFSVTDYSLLGLSLFVGILCALAIALIIGAFVEDVKSIQGVITPLMILIMIPYFVTMMLDFTSLPQYVQYLLYANPFSHPFLASHFIYMNNYPPVIYGIIFQFAVFLVFVYIASRIFSTDHIVTMKLNFSKKRS